MMINKQLIILEGPDGGGKTTLAEKLQKDLNFDCSHFGISQGMSGNDLCMCLISKMEYVLSNRVNLIFDRSWLSEYIYGPKIRNKDRLTTHNYHILNTLAELCNAKVIFCLPNPPTIIDNFEKSSDEYLDSLKQLGCIDGAYRLMADDYNRLPSMTYDYQNTDYLELINFIKRR